MMTPLERAARAMYDNVQPEWDWDDPDAELLRRMYLDNARAALNAVREPTDAMKSAGAEVTRFIAPDEGDGAYESEAANTWRFMISALLSE